MTGKKKARTVNEWLDMEKVDGYTIANAKFLREYNYLYRQLRKQALILYCIGVEMQNYYLSKLMYSAKNQARFCSAVCVQMKTKKVESEYATMFEKNVSSTKRRLETIERITKEDIHLTEYEPFFEAVIYDCDDPKDIDYREIAEMAKKWNEEHADLVRQHLDAIQPEVERHNSHIQRIKEERKKEKEQKKQAKKAEDEYVKEIKRNAQKDKTRQRRIERSFEKYYKGGDEE